MLLFQVTQNLEEAVSEAIDRLVTRGCLTVEEYGNSASTRKSNTAHELGFDEFQVDNDQWIKVRLNLSECFKIFQQVLVLISYTLDSFLEFLYYRLFPTFQTHGCTALY